MVKINPARIAALLRAVRDGNYFKHAAEAVGVHYTTAYEWSSRGNELIAAARLERPDIEAELADWMLVFPDDFTDDNPMWDSPPPTPFYYPDWLYVLFAIGLRKAKAQAVSDAIKGIRKAGEESWQAYAWWLERTHPDQYGRKQSLTHSSPEGGPVEVASVDANTLLERLRELKLKREQGE